MNTPEVNGRPRPKKEPRVMLTCRIARIGLEAVERAAREQGVERSEFVRKALAKAVAEHDAKRGRR